MADNSDGNNVKLSIKSLYDHKIKEIDFNGCETFTKPFTMSESLTDLANRIDFLEDHEDVKNEENLATKAPAPWESIKASLRQALIEMNVLTDVMSIGLNKHVGITHGENNANNNENNDANRYLFFDTAVKETEPENKNFQLASKKSCLAETSRILLQGAEKLSKTRSSMNEQMDYHRQLLNLRKAWRLKRVGDKIKGDLTFMSAGSVFGHPGVFDVVKTAVNSEDSAESKVKMEGMNKPRVSPLTVNIRSDLEGIAVIRVSLKQHKFGEKNMLLSGQNCKVNFHDYSSMSQFRNFPEWHSKLCQAQNVIFCKELFAILTNEAIRFKSDGVVGPFIVIGNSISAQIFPDTELLIEYCNSEEKTDDEDEIKVKQEINSGVEEKSENLYFIKNALVKALQKIHFKHLNVPAPKPCCAVMGLTDEQRHATVSPRTYKNMLVNQEFKNKSLIEQTVMIAKLHVVKQRVRQAIDAVQQAFPSKRLQISTETTVTNYESSIFVSISDATPDDKFRTSAQITASPNQVKGYHNNTVIEFAPDVEDISSFLLNCICYHQIYCTRVVAMNFGWKCGVVSPFSGIDVCHGEHGSLLLTSPFAECKVSARFLCTITDGMTYEVLVKHSTPVEKVVEEMTFFAPQQNSIFTGFWQKVDCDAIPGSKTFSKKLEKILVILNTKLQQESTSRSPVDFSF